MILTKAATQIGNMFTVHTPNGTHIGYISKGTSNGKVAWTAKISCTLAATGKVLTLNCKGLCDPSSALTALNRILDNRTVVEKGDVNWCTR